MSLALRWTEQAVNQLGTVAEYISVASPIYAEQVVERLVARRRQAQDFPLSGRLVPELSQTDLRELIEPPYRVIYRVRPTVIEVVAIPPCAGLPVGCCGSDRVYACGAYTATT